MSALSFRPIALAIALALVACGRGERAEPPRAASTAPQRIISLGPSGTEILASLGAIDRMIGRSNWDLWPDTVRVIPAIGDAIRPSVERIVALRPDLVVLYAAADNVAATEALRAAGVEVVALRIDTIDEYFAALDSLGTRVGARPRADSIALALRQQLDDVRVRASRATRVRVFIPVWEQPLMTVGAGSFLTELVTIAGGENIYADQQKPSLTVSFEDVVRRDPDVVLTGPVSAARLRVAREWQGLRAVREGHVLAFDTTLVSQPSSRLGEGAKSLADLLAGIRK
jgi:ABC-type Fe3+-hydroxamate transport system substrate-binding protein